MQATELAQGPWGCSGKTHAEMAAPTATCGQGIIALAQVAPELGE